MWRALPFTIVLGLTALLVACGQLTVQPTATSTPLSPTATSSPAAPTPTVTQPSPTAIPNAFAQVPGIVDPSNSGWPRTVEGLNGRITIEQKPQRIITVSVGHDEMTLALVPRERLVGVGAATKDSTFSNVAELVQDIPEVSRDPEVIVAQAPDVVVTSPFMAQETVEALTKVGVPVIQTNLNNDPEGRVQDILLLGYIYGEEDRAIAFAEEVRQRFQTLTSVTRDRSPTERPRVLALTRYSDKVWTAGTGSTEGAVIDAAGGINAAAEAGIDQNQVTTLEGVISMSPDVIFIAQPIAFGGAEFKEALLGDPALAEVPAIKEERVYLVDSKLFTTLSFWNLRGAEELAKLLWPDDLGDTTFPAFSRPE